MTDEPTVFVVDGDSETRDAVLSLVHTMNLRCQAYASGQEFLADFEPSRPGCVVMEIRIPEVNGVQIQEKLAGEASPLPVIFLTQHATVSIAVRAMRAGALHVIEKPFREHELWDAIQEAIELDRRRRRLAKQRKKMERRVADLNDKERAFLQLIAEGKAKEAMAAELGVCVRTVEIRRKQLMKKLDLSAPIELVQVALATTDLHPPRNHGLHNY